MALHDFWSHLECDDFPGRPISYFLTCQSAIFLNKRGSSRPCCSFVVEYLLVTDLCFDQCRTPNGQGSSPLPDDETLPNPLPHPG